LQSDCFVLQKSDLLELELVSSCGFQTLRFSILSSNFRSFFFNHSSSTVNLSNLVCIELHCRSGRTSPLLSLAEKGDVRAMALQVSALSKDLFVFLRLHSHHPSTLRTTARYSSSDTASSSYLFLSVSRLQKNAAHHCVLFGSTYVSICTFFPFLATLFASQPHLRSSVERHLFPEV